MVVFCLFEVEDFGLSGGEACEAGVGLMGDGGFCLVKGEGSFCFLR